MSKLNYIGIGDAETKLKYLDNYMNSAKTVFKNNLIDDIYKTLLQMDWLMLKVLIHT